MSLVIAAAAVLWAAPSRADGRFTVLVIGDSLSAAYGMATEDGWVALLGERLAGRDIEVVNRSVSGDTTAGGAGRLGSALTGIRPDVVIIELGANDGLRGISPQATEDNLARMIAMSREAGAHVLLLGMRMPPNYGPEYTEAFAAVFPRLAERFDIALVPFFLEPVAEDWDMVQADGIHPNAAAQPLLLEHVWPRLAPLLPAPAD
ncbi:MAG: arylesterase [Gammaproteobacteria bacterium]|nr:arylesterase [Gammaproteobacteria bacterium]